MKKTERLKKEKFLRKTLILDAAMKIFARVGYDKTTMNDIAKEAGYSKANMYFYFKNKEEVFLDLLKDEMKKRRGMLQGILQMKVAPESKIGQFIENSFRYVNEHIDLIRILHSEQNKLSQLGKKEKFRKDLLNDQFATINILAKIINEGIESGEYRKTDSREVAMLLMGMVGAAIMYWFHNNKEVDLDKYRMRILEVLLTGISK